MIAGELPDIPEFMNVGSLKVHAPSAVVIVCGGATTIDYSQPVMSLRDAFMRISTKPKLAKFDIRQAEDVVKLPLTGYSDVLQLESDISQISELVLLFTESPGSLAELGIFVMDEEVSPRLMVVVDRFNYKQESFIRRGALDFLESSVGEQAVCVIDLPDYGAANISNVGNLDIDLFETFIEGKISARLLISPEPRTFNKNRNGHLIKLMTGLIQNYGALTMDEIDVLLWAMNINIDVDFCRRLLACAELFEWIKIEKFGTRTFYSAAPGRIAIAFDAKDSQNKVNRGKWRTDIREYWLKTDADRFKAIASATAGGVL